MKTIYKVCEIHYGETNTEYKNTEEFDNKSDAIDFVKSICEHGGYEGEDMASYIDTTVDDAYCVHTYNSEDDEWSSDPLVDDIYIEYKNMEEVYDNDLILFTNTYIIYEEEIKEKKSLKMSE